MSLAPINSSRFSMNTVGNKFHLKAILKKYIFCQGVCYSRQLRCVTMATAKQLFQLKNTNPSNLRDGN